MRIRIKTDKLHVGVSRLNLNDKHNGVCHLCIAHFIEADIMDADTVQFDISSYTVICPQWVTVGYTM